MDVKVPQSRSGPDESRDQAKHGGNPKRPKKETSEGSAGGDLSLLKRPRIATPQVKGALVLSKLVESQPHRYGSPS
jgi:hypothetical protein